MQMPQHIDAPAYLGAVMDPATPALALVAAVTPGSPAESAGLRRGDVITSLNGAPIHSSDDAAQMLSALHPGDPVDIGFSRRVDNQTRVTLGSAPPKAENKATPQ